MLDATSSNAAKPAASRILIADDDPILRQMAHTKLSADGHQVLEVSDGGAAWNRVTNESFDLAIVDLGMPQVDGFRLISFIRSHPRTQNMPVIVVTSRNDAAAIEEAFRLGATSFLTKPINWMLFGHEVRYVLRSAAATEALRLERERAEIAGKLKENLLKMLGHEVHTPVRLMSDIATMMMSEQFGPLGDQRYAGQVRRLSRLGRHIEGTLTDFALFLQLNTGELAVTEQEFDLGDLLLAARQHVQQEASEAGITIEDAGCPPGYRVWCDGRLFLAALKNLLDVAIRFGAAGGVVRVGATPRSDGSMAVTISGEAMRAEAKPVPAEGGVAKSKLIHRSGETASFKLTVVESLAALHGGRLAFREGSGSAPAAIVSVPTNRVHRVLQAAAS